MKKKTTHDLAGCRCPEGSDIRFCLGQPECTMDEKCQCEDCKQENGAMNNGGADRW